MCLCRVKLLSVESPTTKFCQPMTALLTRPCLTCDCNMNSPVNGCATNQPTTRPQGMGKVSPQGHAKHMLCLALSCQARPHAPRPSFISGAQGTGRQHNKRALPALDGCLAAQRCDAILSKPPCLGVRAHGGDDHDHAHAVRPGCRLDRSYLHGQRALTQGLEGGPYNHHRKLSVLGYSVMH